MHHKKNVFKKSIDPFIEFIEFSFGLNEQHWR